MRVLLVDDSSSNRLVLGSLLEDEGMEVAFAESCAEARGLLAAASADAYDVVLLDLHLGDGLGTELVRTMRERIPRAKIVMISGSSAEGELPDGAGLDATIEKGGDFSDLVALMNRVVAGDAGDR